MATSNRYDVIIAGLGAMGSATAAHLALRGKRVLGLERWVPGHPYGSSHGDSRIIREMYFEHPMYVPLLKRAYELWYELGERTGDQLFQLIGGLMIGPKDGKLVTGVLKSAETYGLPYDMLSPPQVTRRFPAFSLRDDLVAVHDPRGGFLDPEECNRAHQRVASKAGADLHFEEPVLAWTSSHEGVSVETPTGFYQADHLVLAVGARMLSLLDGLDLPLEVERQAVFWIEPQSTGREYNPWAFPIYAYEYMPGEICYGFPRMPRGVKASIMHSGEIIDDPDTVRRKVFDVEFEPLCEALESILPSLAKGRVRDRDVCLFTNTPDHDFIIDFHPAHPRVLLSSACSGHGFKFASVIGEIQADLVTSGQSKFDLTPFSVTRPSLGRLP